MPSFLKQRGPAVSGAQGQSPAHSGFLLAAEEQQFWRSQGLLAGSTTSVLLRALSPPATLVSLSTLDMCRTHTAETSRTTTSTTTLTKNPGHRKERKA